jgi:hypothetical protein
MLLQGYFDDSGTHEGRNADYVCVLGGFMAPVENWKAFSIDWAAKLDENPGIRYFRMTEAMRLTGEFARGWTRSVRDQRVFELAEIIKTHAVVRVDSVMKRGWYNSLVRTIDREWDDPYYFLFMQLLWSVQDYQAKHDQAVCDLILDVQGNMEVKILSKWQAFQDFEPNETRRKMMDSPPLFRDDRSFLPLQAADMYAWLVRDHVSRSIREERRDTSKKQRVVIDASVKQLRTLENISREYSFESLMNIGARMMVARAKGLGFLR